MVIKNEKKDFIKKYNKFKVALIGIKVVFLEESSFRYQFLVLLLTIVFGFLFNIVFLEWIIIFIMATLVFCLETINTAIENLIDMVKPDYNIVAGKIKDICAGAVLIATIGSVIVGLIIFIPKVLLFLEGVL